MLENPTQKAIVEEDTNGLVREVNDTQVFDNRSHATGSLLFAHPQAYRRIISRPLPILPAFSFPHDLVPIPRLLLLHLRPTTTLPPFLRRLHRSRIFFFSFLVTLKLLNILESQRARLPMHVRLPSMLDACPSFLKIRVTTRTTLFRAPRRWWC